MGDETLSRGIYECPNCGDVIERLDFIEEESNNVISGNYWLECPHCKKWVDFSKAKKLIPNWEKVKRKLIRGNENDNDNRRTT